MVIYFIICSAISEIIIRIPNREKAKKYSAIVSSWSCLILFIDRIEKNENRQEIISDNATTVVNSSIILNSL